MKEACLIDKNSPIGAAERKAYRVSFPLLNLATPNLRIDRGCRSHVLRLTHRDLGLLRWVNAVGCVTINQIAQKLKVSQPTAYIRAKKLVTHRYLLHERIFHGEAGIYRVTLEGVQVSGSPLPALRKVSLASYHHDLLVTTLSLKLLDRFSGSYIPERELRHGDGLNRFGKAGHTPDSVLLIGGKKIAIEVELSKKSKRRRSEIFNYYLKNFDYKEVWYFCGDREIETQLKPFLEKSSFIQAYQIQEFLSDMESAYGRSNQSK